MTTSDPNNAWTIDLTYTTTEPLLFLSPFVSDDDLDNQAGLYGVRNIDLTLNFNSSAKRTFCNGTAIPMTISLHAITGCKLNLNYLTSQPSDLIASKNVVPFSEYARFLTPSAASCRRDPHDSHPGLAAEPDPKQDFVVARKRLADQTIQDSSSFWPISSVSVNFNNKSGILPSASAHDLYRMSVENGRKESWYEFYGKDSKVEGKNAPSAGSILVIDPSRDLCLPDYLTNGSIGSYSFAMQLTVQNTEAAATPTEVMIICQYDGVFVTETGISSKQTGLLTKDLVEKHYGEPSAYVKERGFANLGNRGISASKNVPLLNVAKSGSGVRSGGALSGGGGLSHCTY